jgi:YgiT-type zinc finger domain-containing protein
VRCRVCGGGMEERVTDLPFKIGDTSIVIVRALPVLQCRQCGEAELENVAMGGGRSPARLGGSFRGTRSCAIRCLNQDAGRRPTPQGAARCGVVRNERG